MALSICCLLALTKSCTANQDEKLTGHETLSQPAKAETAKTPSDMENLLRLAFGALATSSVWKIPTPAQRMTKREAGLKSRLLNPYLDERQCVSGSFNPPRPQKAVFAGAWFHAQTGILDKSGNSDSWRRTWLKWV